MNEPLTNSRPGIAFSGKTYNHHPQWYNQPLRLSPDEIRDLLPVVDDFFDNYHLQDVRQTLWHWVTAVITSSNSISIDPIDRSNQFYFYEKIERLVEFAFVMKNKMHKHRRRKEKRRLKKGTHAQKEQVVTVNASVNNASINRPVVDNEENVDLFNKPKQLIEYVDADPLYVIREVFKNDSLFFLRDQLRDWLFVAVSADTAIYEDEEQRKQLLSFQDQLLVLVEALFIINSENIEKVSLTDADKPRLLSQDQIANPLQVVTAFFKKLPITYCIRELDDWHEAGIAYTGDYPENMSELEVLFTYRNVLCLIKAAHRLLIK